MTVGEGFWKYMLPLTELCMKDQSNSCARFTKAIFSVFIILYFYRQPSNSSRNMLLPFNVGNRFEIISATTPKVIFSISH